MPELKDNCCQKQREGGFLGAEPGSGSSDGRWRGGGWEVVISQTAPSESPVSATGQPGEALEVKELSEATVGA